MNLVSIHNKGKEKYFTEHSFVADPLTYSNSEVNSTPPFLQMEIETREIKGDLSKVMQLLELYN